MTPIEIDRVVVFDKWNAVFNDTRIPGKISDNRKFLSLCLMNRRSNRMNEFVSLT